MHSRQGIEAAETKDVRVVCGWCGRLLRESAASHAPTSHGICALCARVLESPHIDDKSLPSEELFLSKIEEHTNGLMCRLYESRQVLLDIQRRVSNNGELLGRVGQALTSIKHQERIVAAIQKCLTAAQD